MERLTALRSLKLFDAGESEVGLIACRFPISLEHLNLEYVWVDTAVLASMAVLKNLQLLELNLIDRVGADENEDATALTASLLQLTQLTALRLDVPFLNDGVVATWPTWLAQLRSSSAHAEGDA